MHPVPNAPETHVPNPAHIQDNLILTARLFRLLGSRMYLYSPQGIIHRMIFKYGAHALMNDGSRTPAEYRIRFLCFAENSCTSTLLAKNCFSHNAPPRLERMCASMAEVGSANVYLSSVTANLKQIQQKGVAPQRQDYRIR